jgi:hypothetical protein
MNMMIIQMLEWEVRLDKESEKKTARVDSYSTPRRGFDLFGGFRRFFAKSASVPSDCCPGVVVQGNH